MIIVYILITILIIGLLVLVHELGHFLAARLFKVRVLEFSIGMGPVLFQREKNGTKYSIRAFPIGGYCNLQENTDDKIEYVPLLDGYEAEIVEKHEDLNPEESFETKKTWQKIVILVAGVFMNFLLAYLVLYLALLIANRGIITSFKGAYNLFIQLFYLIFLSIKMIFTGHAGVNELIGPVGMVSVVQEYYAFGFTYLLLFLAMLSVNLGIVNLLPIPALDGGQIVVVLVEKLRKKSISEKVKGAIFTLSYILLIGLGVYVAFNDIFRIFS